MFLAPLKETAVIGQRSVWMHAIYPVDANLPYHHMLVEVASAPKGHNYGFLSQGEVEPSGALARLEKFWCYPFSLRK